MLACTLYSMIGCPELEDDWLNSRDAVTAGVTFYVKVFIYIDIQDVMKIVCMFLCIYCTLYGYSSYLGLTH